MTAFKVADMIPFMIYAADGTRTYPKHFEPKKKKSGGIVDQQQYTSCQLTLAVDRRELYWKLERESSADLDPFFK